MRNLTIGAALLVACQVIMAQSEVHWGYSGQEGPEYWSSLSDDFALCASGKNQSPINIQPHIEADLQPIKFSYQAGAREVENNGHTVQVNYAPGSTISIEGHAFELTQFHFHAPSENLIRSHSFPMEAHLVHADKDGNMAVVTVMFEQGATNAELEKVWSVMPEAQNSASLAAPLSAEALLPNNRAYYRFNGSLTTPPCSEGVVWLVLKESVQASEAQVAVFEHMMQHPNNRPVQQVNARPVLQ